MGPRERLVHPVPPACQCCGDTTLRMIGEDENRDAGTCAGILGVIQHVREKARKIEELLPWNRKRDRICGGGMKDSIIRVSINLLDVDPAIWRRIEVPGSFTLEGLHDVIQIVMGWADYHLHHFQFGSVMYGAPTPDDREMNHGRKIKLSTAIVDGERASDYVYDYGDNRCCMVVLEAVRPDDPGHRLSALRRRRQGAVRPRTSAVPGAIGGSWRP